MELEPVLIRLRAIVAQTGGIEEALDPFEPVRHDSTLDDLLLKGLLYVGAFHVRTSWPACSLHATQESNQLRNVSQSNSARACTCF